MPATTDALIILYVDTVNIPVPAPSGSSDPSVLDHVFIASNHTDSASPPQSPTTPGGKTTFKTDLKSNSQIAWVGAVQDIMNHKDDYVLISGISIQPSQDGIGIVTGDGQPVGNNHPGSGYTHVDGMLRKNPPPGGPGCETIYTIHFSVCHNGVVTDGYQIDPKMRMT